MSLERNQCKAQQRLKLKYQISDGKKSPDKVRFLGAY